MPQKFENSILGLDEIPEVEYKHIPLSCLWTLTSNNTSLTVIITCLKWTFNYDFCVQVTAHLLGAPNVLKQLDLDDYHPLLTSLIDALYLYESFPEPLLNAYQREILEELIGYVS